MIQSNELIFQTNSQTVGSHRISFVLFYSFFSSLKFHIRITLIRAIAFITGKSYTHFKIGNPAKSPLKGGGITHENHDSASDRNLIDLHLRFFFFSFFIIIVFVFLYCNPVTKGSDSGLSTIGSPDSFTPCFISHLLYSRSARPLRSIIRRLR